MEIIINGNTIIVQEIHREVLLLDFIRDVAGLKGTKFGCGTGLCGACTLHVDGAAERSCQVFVNEVAGRRITTIEGLAATAPEATLHPVQKSWIENSVPQCGYCQAGQIMSAAALLRRNSNPSGDEIDLEMSGNLCRCGTYQRIRQAITEAAKEISNADNS